MLELFRIAKIQGLTEALCDANTSEPDLERLAVRLHCVSTEDWSDFPPSPSRVPESAPREA